MTKSRFQVEWATDVKKDLQALDKNNQKRILAAVELLRVNPRPAKMKKLVSPDPKYRVRVGDYRIIYQIEDSKLIILVLRIGHRRDIYRNRN